MAKAYRGNYPSKTYHGRYSVKNPSKYNGDPSNVVFRSLWERQLMKFFDDCPDVTKWASEATVVGYICGTDRKPHRYFVDFTVTFKNGETHLVELKPKKETIPPKVPKKKTQRYLVEAMTFIKNQSKWTAASKYAEERGWKFSVWTEVDLSKFGIRLITS